MFTAILNRFRYIRSRLRDPATSLYYHGMDESRAQKWANPVTGCSSAFWLRGMGWLLMALNDTAVHLPSAQSAIKKELSEMLNESVCALLCFRAEDRLFYQVIDRPDAVQNYTETSGSLRDDTGCHQACCLPLFTKRDFPYSRLSNQISSGKQIPA